MATKTTTKTTSAPAKAQTGKKAQAARQGLVAADTRDKTRKVILPNTQVHPKYGKIIRKRTVLQVHDASNTSRTGDLVEIAPCNPVSKTKRWALVRVVRKGASMKFEGVEAPGNKN